MYDPEDSEQNEVGRSGPVLYCDEDLYCQVELLPRENFFHLMKENGNLESFAHEHSEPEGFSDIYVRETPAMSIRERQILVKDLECLISQSGFKKASVVYYGYGAQRPVFPHCGGFKLDFATIFYDFEGDRVKNIWIDGFRFNQASEYKSELINCLYSMGQKWNLILNDWDLAQTIDLNDKLKVENYISEE